MPIKIFTTLGGMCPFGKRVPVDSGACRNCADYFRAGPGPFFWCRHQKPKRGRPKAAAPAAPEVGKRKRGRPRKNAAKVPEN